MCVGAEDAIAGADKAVRKISVATQGGGPKEKDVSVQESASEKDRHGYAFIEAY